MAISETEAVVVVMANAIGIYDERGKDIKALEATAVDEESLGDVCNAIGYPDETAERLIGQGLTLTAIQETVIEPETCVSDVEGQEY